MRPLTMLLGVNSVLFILFGLGFIIEPYAISQAITGFGPQGINAAIDMRATYGGMALGFGIFLSWVAYVKRGVMEAGLASILVMAGLALGRLTGMVLDGTPNTMILALFGAELLFGTALFWAFIVAKKTGGH